VEIIWENKDMNGLCLLVQAVLLMKKMDSFWVD